MSRKAQLVSNIMLYILIVLIGGIVLIMSIAKISDLKENNKNAQIINFALSLENALKAQSYHGYKSIKPITLSLPYGVEKVCFRDETEMLSPYHVTELDKEIKIYEDRNVFFFPSGSFGPLNVESVGLNKGDNPLCVNVVAGKVDLKLVTGANKTRIEAPNADIAADYYTIWWSGDPEEKIDLVFLGYDYKDNESFNDDVYNYVYNYFFNIKPFKENKDMFNIHRINKFDKLDCKVTFYISCDSFNVKKLASNAPNDYIFILADDVKSSVRSSAISNMAKINTKDDGLVLLHEFGHIFANLADEYVDEYYDDFDASGYPNCDLEDRCPGKWSELTSECFMGCSTNEFSRGTEYSIMRNYRLNKPGSKEYGIINENEIDKKIGVYK
ncbi:MAG: hypothetical protein KAU20_02190 [Nanoarchaeota archaeon]|nr:hypothetical protein [Nanoarchaeota archaeon]